MVGMLEGYYRITTNDSNPKNDVKRAFLSDLMLRKVPFCIIRFDFVNGVINVLVVCKS